MPTEIIHKAPAAGAEAMPAAKESGAFLGKRVSGRFWKADATKSPNCVASRGCGKRTWNVKIQERKEKALEKTMLSEITQERKEKKEIIKRQREANRKRREQNIERTQVVQKVTNSKKLRRMTKQQRSKLQIQKQ